MLASVSRPLAALLAEPLLERGGTPSNRLIAELTHHRSHKSKSSHLDFDGGRRPRPKCWGLAWPWAGGRTVGRHDSTAERSIVGPRELRPRTWPWGNDPPEDGRLDLTIHSVTKERTTVHRTRCPAGPHRLLVRRRTPPRPEAQTGGELVGSRVFVRARPPPVAQVLRTS